MAGLDSGDTDYDTDIIDTVGTLESPDEDTDWARANGASRAIIAMQNKLGTALDGNKENLKTRLLVCINADGKLESPTGTDLDDRLLTAMDTAGLLKLSDVIQIQYTTDNAVSAALSTNIPFDDTIPQNTEGDEVLTQAITPKSATSILEIVAIIHISAAAAEHLIAALFVDSTADALSASVYYKGAADNMEAVIVRHRVISGSTSARTYKIRIGTETQNVVMNGITTGPARRLGGVLISSLRITEWQV